MALPSPVSHVREARAVHAKIIVPKSIAVAMVDVGAVSAAVWEKGKAAEDAAPDRSPSTACEATAPADDDNASASVDMVEFYRGCSGSTCL